jgi:ATPase family associated with various cellular activities (AAA)
MSYGDLQVLLSSRVPLIVVESRDESRVLKLLQRACRRATAAAPAPTGSGAGDMTGNLGLGLPLFEWTITDGLRRLDTNGGAQRNLSDPADMLRHVRATNLCAAYALVDFHPFLKDPLHVRMLKDICLEYERCARTLILLSAEIEMPRELEDLSVRCDLALPDRSERRQIVADVARQWANANPGKKLDMDPKAMELFVENLSGLSAADTLRLARKTIFEEGALARSDVPDIMLAKYELLNRHGILRYEHDTAAVSEIGGLNHFKAWLEPRRAAFDGSAPELDPPKGVLLLGVQGCGKSLAARAAAAVFGLPLLSLDCAALFDKFVGETERNLRESLSTAGLLAPCVLWIDEIEKGFATGDSDSGTSRRVMGSFLTWLAEKHARVFVLATANDIISLPPELIRKGRFDEIFFVDLPDALARSEILSIHLRKRGMVPDDRTVALLVRASEGFSGAEIEQAVVAARYTAKAHGTPPSAESLLAEIQATRPLSILMAEKISALRRWAAERTVPAG